jgi:hypothetical protein
VTAFSADILVYQYLSESIHFATICCADAKRLFSRIPAFSFGCGLAALRCIADILVGEALTCDTAVRNDCATQ